MKVIALLALLSVAVQLTVAAPADKVDCSKIDEVLDDAGAAQGFSTLNDKYKLATNAEEMKKRCKEMAEAITTLRKYNQQCNTALTQQVFSAIIRTRSQMNADRCKETDEANFKNTYEATKCIQDNALEKVKEAERKTILQSQVLLDKKIEKEDLRVRGACCAVLASRNLFLEATKEKCAKYEKVYSDYVDSYTSEAFGLICPEADKLKCSELEPLKVDGVSLKSQFFLNPMLKLVKTLDH